ncbi:MAG TPA: type 4a pilus biogenesis protein PilO [Gallionellaceae bacterium]
MDLKKFWSDLQNVNPKDPGGWPWAVKGLAFLLIFLAVIGGGYVAVWQDQWDEYSSKVDQEEKLKTTFLDDKRKAINLDLIKKQLNDTKQSFSALLKQLPSKAEMDVLLSDINQAGLGRGLSFELFHPNREVITGVLTEQPIAIKVTGTYDDLGKFASDVSQLNRIVILNDINIIPDPSGNLVMDATARTYRYRDEDEAAQKAGVKK